MDTEFAFGTRSGEIYFGKVQTKTSNNQDATPILDKDDEGRLKISLRSIVRSHSDSQITGVAVSHMAPEFFSIGTNNILMKWHYDSKTLRLSKKLDFPAKLLELSVNNNFLAVGCYNGTVLVMSPVTLETVHCHNTEKKEVSCLSFSPSNENLAIGYVNGVLNVLSSPMKFSMSMEIRDKNMSPLVSLDFSEDNCFLRGTFWTLDTVIYDVTKRTVLRTTDKSASRPDEKPVAKTVEQLADERWSQWTSLFGWEVQGIWSEYESPREVVGACRNEDKDILVIWDRYGGVKCYRYPVLNHKAPFLRISMNGMRISTVRFNSENTKLFILGNNDSSIIQYSIVYDSSENQQKIFKTQDKMILPDLAKKETPAASKMEPQKPRIYLSDLPFLWPKTFDKALLSREFSFINMQVKNGVGINKREFMTPIMRAGNDTLVYFCGTAFVQHTLGRDKKQESRTFSHFHSRRVSAMDVSKLNNYVATGEAADDPSHRAMIAVHDLDQSEVISRIYLPEGESCRFIRFSPGKDTLICISEFDNCYKIMLIDWVNSLLVQSLPIGSNKINDISFRNDEEFVTVGDNHLLFWRIDGNKLDPTQGNYGNAEIPEFTACEYAFEKKLLFTGTSGGFIASWGSKDRTLGESFQAHQGAVMIMMRHKTDTLFTAGSEGVILRWGFSDKLSRQAEVYDLKDIYQVPTKYFSINPALSDIVVVSENGDAVRAGTKEKSGIVFREIASEITAVYFADTENQLIVATADSRLLSMSSINYKINDMDKNKNLVKQGLYICSIVRLHIGNNYIVGDSKGVIHSMRDEIDFEDTKHHIVMTTFNQPHNRIKLMRLSENEQYLAVSSTQPGNKMEIYEVKKDSLARLCSIATNCLGIVTAFDWDTQSKFILVNTDRSEVALLDILTVHKPIAMSSARNLEWHTMTTMFNYFSGGLHSKADGSTDITAVCTKKGLPFLIAGTNKGSVGSY